MEYLFILNDVVGLIGYGVFLFIYILNDVVGLIEYGRFICTEMDC